MVEDDELKPFTKAQERTIESLERALARCARDGIDLYAYDIGMVAVRKGVGDGLDIPEIRRLDDEYVHRIVDHGAYRDCGAGE